MKNIEEIDAEITIATKWVSTGIIAISAIVLLTVILSAMNHYEYSLPKSEYQCTMPTTTGCDQYTRIPLDDV